MLEVLILCEIFSIIISIALFFITFTDKSGICMYYGCPKYIYDNSTLNVFGVILVFLLFFILMPIYHIIWFWYWLFHVGRKAKKRMSLDKAIEHGKEKRKPYKGAKAIDCTCRNHGSCEWCKGNRLYQQLKIDESSRQALEELNGNT